MFACRVGGSNPSTTTTTTTTTTAGMSAVRCLAARGHLPGASFRYEAYPDISLDVKEGYEVGGRIMSRMDGVKGGKKAGPGPAGDGYPYPYPRFIHVCSNMYDSLTLIFILLGYIMFIRWDQGGFGPESARNRTQRRPRGPRPPRWRKPSRSRTPVAPGVLKKAEITIRPKKTKKKLLLFLKISPSGTSMSSRYLCFSISRLPSLAPTTCLFPTSHLSALYRPSPLTPHPPTLQTNL